MALKKRSLKLAITTMAIISVVTSGGLNNIYADSSINESSIVIKRNLEDKNYSVKNKIEYVKDGTIQSSGSGYETLRSSVSENSVIEVKDGKIYMTIEFTDADYGNMGKMYDFIQNVRIVVDGKEHKFEKSDDKKYKVEIGSLESDIQLIYDINAQMGAMVYTKTFEMNVRLTDTPELEVKNNAPVINVTDKTVYVGEEFDALSGATSNVATDAEDGDLTSKLEITNNVDTSKPRIYEVTYKVEDSQGLVTTKTIKVTVLAKEEIKPNGLEDGKYTVKNKTTYSGNSSMGTSMVRNSLNEVSYIEVKDGEVYITIEFNKDMYSMMKDIKISVDGNTIKPSVEGMKYTFKANSINSNIEVSASITAMNGMNIKYAVALDESTIEKITSDSNIGNNNGTTEETTNGSSNSSTNENTSSSENTTVENTVKKGKLYTIKNTVSHDS